MSSIVPTSRPQYTLGDVVKQIGARGVTDPVVLFAIRGYYRDSLGVKGENDRGVFDDMICLKSRRTFKTFNANTDPSDPDTGTRLATLQPGTWHFKLGTHHPGTPGAYPCLVQAAPVTVHRDNGVTETGEFYIHIHHGGVNTTTSAGCQTIYRPQWDEFLALVRSEMEFAGVHEIPYILTVNEAS
jgi:hypothetical protein